MKNSIEEKIYKNCTLLIKKLKCNLIIIISTIFFAFSFIGCINYTNTPDEYTRPKNTLAILENSLITNNFIRFNSLISQNLKTTYPDPASLERLRQKLQAIHLEEGELYVVWEGPDQFSELENEWIARLVGSKSRKLRISCRIILESREKVNSKNNTVIVQKLYKIDSIEFNN